MGMKKEIKQNKDSNLSAEEAGKEYIIRDIATDDEELNSFLFSLGCYSGEAIAVAAMAAVVVYLIKREKKTFDREYGVKAWQI